MEIENLQIDDKTSKPSSSHSNKTPKELEQFGSGQDNRSREEIRMERKAKAAEARARKSRYSLSLCCVLCVCY